MTSVPFSTRDGRFERLLGPGRFTALDFGRRLAAEVVKVVRAEIAGRQGAAACARRTRHVAAENFEIVQLGANEVAIVSFDGEPKHLVMPNATRAFWKAITKVDVERIDAGRRTCAWPSATSTARPDAHAAGRARRGRGARGGPAVHRRQADRASAGWPARVLGGGPDGQDPEGRYASDAARGDGAGDPDQGSRRHPRDADGVHAGRSIRRRRRWRRAMCRTRSTGSCSSRSGRRWRRARWTRSWRRATRSTARCARS